jgi:ferredoxin
MECIACTACVDACDEVMRRTKRPPGLIRYASQASLEGKGTRRFSARAAAYSGVLGILLCGLVWTLYRRERVEVNLLRAAEAPYQELVNDRVVNHFKLDLYNLSFEDLSVELAVKPELKEAGVSLVISNHAPSLIAGTPERADLFVQYPKSLLRNGSATIEVMLLARAATGEVAQQTTKEVRLVGPYR